MSRFSEIIDGPRPEDVFFAFCFEAGFLDFPMVAEKTRIRKTLEAENSKGVFYTEVFERGESSIRDERDKDGRNNGPGKRPPGVYIDVCVCVFSWGPPINN